METPQTLVEKTGLTEKQIEGILGRLQRKGLVKTNEDGFIFTTPEGDKIMKTLKLYGYPATVAVKDVLKVRQWANENKGKTVSFDDVKALGLTIHNKKVGRILTVLGCKRQKKHGRIFYTIPAELEKMQLRDLTRTKRGHLAKQRQKWEGKQ
jgi:Mn-dependent DtxR family transcriptional regulator